MKIDEKWKNEDCSFACQWFKKLIDDMSVITSGVRYISLRRDFC